MLSYNVCEIKEEKYEKTLDKTIYFQCSIIIYDTYRGPYLLISVISIFAKQLSGSDTYAGMMASIFALSGLFARFISSYLLDHYSIKKTLIISESLMVLASFIYVFCDSYWLAFALRGIQGFGYSIAVTSMSTYIVKIIPIEYRLEGIGYSSLTSSLANVVGPMIAFVILGEKYTGFQSLFIVVLITAMIALLGFVSLKESSKNIEEKNQIHDNQKLNWFSILLPFIILFIVNLANAAPSSLLSLYAIEKEFNDIGFYFSMSAIGLIISRFTMNKIVKKLGNEKSILFFSLLITLCLFGISQTNALYQLYFIGLILGFSSGAILPLINTIIINRLPDSKAGLGNAIFFAAGDIGFIIGATLWGSIAGRSSYTIMFIIVAFTSAIAVILSIFQ